MHHHDHHCPSSFNRAFAIGVALNVAFVVIEAAGGFWSHSVALLADAGHNLSDVLGLLLAWAAAYLAAVGPDERRTYGLRRTSIYAALINALILLLATGGVPSEPVQPIPQPAPVPVPTL